MIKKIMIFYVIGYYVSFILTLCENKIKRRKANEDYSILKEPYILIIPTLLSWVNVLEFIRFKRIMLKEIASYILNLFISIKRLDN